MATKDGVFRFIETNISLLDEGNYFEFFISAYNALSSYECRLLVDVLRPAIDDIEVKVEPVIRYIVSRTLEDVLKHLPVQKFVLIFFPYGLFNLNTTQLANYIVNNADEWENNIEYIKGQFIICSEE